MANSDFFTRKGHGAKTSLKALTVVIKPEANFVSLVEEGVQIQQNWVWNSFQEYKVKICDRSERSWYKEVFRWEPAILLSLFLVMHLSKSHSSWLCNSIERVRKCKQILTQHKMQPQAKTKYLEFNTYLLLVQTGHIDNEKKKHSKMAKVRVNWDSVFSFWVSELWQMHRKSLGIV